MFEEKLSLGIELIEKYYPAYCHMFTNFSYNFGVLSKKYISVVNFPYLKVIFFIVLPDKAFERQINNKTIVIPRI